jgi:hypothetical protein
MYGVFCCDISIYMYKVPQLGSAFHHFSLFPLLKMTSTGFYIPHLQMHRKPMNHVYLPSPLHLPSLPVLLCPKQDLVYIPVLLCLRVCFRLALSSVNILHSNQSNPSTPLPHPFPPTLCWFFSCVLLCLVPIHMWCFSFFTHSPSFFFSSSLSLL